MGECRNNSLCIYCYKPASALDGSHEGNYSLEFLQFFSRFLEIPLKIPVQNQDFVSCDDCFEMGEFFRKLYSQWEKLRLQLEWRVRELFEIIRAAGKVPSRVREFKNQYEINEEDGDGDNLNKVYHDIKKLRKKILRGCKKKLKSSFPRVVLERIPNEDEIVKKVPQPVDSFENFENFEIMQRMMTFIVIFQLSLPQSEASKGNPIHHNVEKCWKVQKQVQTYARDDDDFHPGKDKDGLLPKTAISSVGAHTTSFEADVPEVINMDINESVAKVSEIPVEIEDPSCNEARAQIQQHASTREALDCNPKPVKRRRGRPRLSEKSCVHKASNGSLEIDNSQILDATSKGKYELPSSATTPLLETNPKPLEGDVEMSPKVIDVDVNDSVGEAVVNLPETEAPAAQEVLISLRNFFKCPKCRRKFSNEARANTHIQQHERDSPSGGDLYGEQQVETKKGDSFSLEIISEASAFHAIKAVQVTNPAPENTVSELSLPAKRKGGRPRLSEKNSSFHKPSKVTKGRTLARRYISQKRGTEPKRGILHPRRAPKPSSSSLSCKVLGVKCPICQTSSKNRETLAIHMRVAHHKILTYDCVHCNTQLLRTKDSVRYHMFLIHGKRFKSYKALFAENIRYGSMGGESGESSSTSDRRPPRITESSSSSLGRKILGLKCPICQTTSQTREALAKHTRLFHNKILTYVCLHCNMKLKTMEGFKSHMHFLHGQQFKTNKALLSAENMRYGSMGGQSGDADQNGAPPSTEAVESSSSPPKHLNSEQEPSSSTLSKATETSNKTKRQSKLFRCNTKGCYKRFTARRNLLCHRKKKHTGKARFKCHFDGCFKSFASRQSLKTHERTHTQKNNQSEQEPSSSTLSNATETSNKTKRQRKLFRCNTKGCYKRFTTRRYLLRHRRTHTGKARFKCHFDGCLKSFASRQYLKTHERTHTKNNNQCKWKGCSFEFGGVGELKQHCLQKHKAEQPLNKNHDQQQREAIVNPAFDENVALHSETEERVAEQQPETPIWSTIPNITLPLIRRRPTASLRGGVNPVTPPQHLNSEQPGTSMTAKLNNFASKETSEDIALNSNTDEGATQQTDNWEGVTCQATFPLTSQLSDHIRTEHVSQGPQNFQSNEEEIELEEIEIEMSQDNEPGEVESECVELGLNETTSPTLPGQLEPSPQQENFGVFNDPCINIAASISTIPVPEPSPLLQSGMEVADSLYFVCAHCTFETGDRGELQSHLETHNNPVRENTFLSQSMELDPTENILRNDSADDKDHPQENQKSFWI